MLALRASRGCASPQHAYYHADKILELVHGDICGPITLTTLGGNRYFLLLGTFVSRLGGREMVASLNITFFIIHWIWNFQLRASMIYQIGFFYPCNVRRAFVYHSGVDILVMAC
ncbi:hypothetical protein GUJ93_ZPchr0007g4424 [Zizania palustris]|uniref:Uncharacterized protein n=1 Tax=Zizania palustris TaxID=103762 RepID=A0A8J5VUC4_ZIZPA|nr:hypothetical protein GUJ93_ZPchr0007g4424 [Zizania palustris]